MKKTDQAHHPRRVEEIRPSITGQNRLFSTLQFMNYIRMFMLYLGPNAAHKRLLVQRIVGAHWHLHRIPAARPISRPHQQLPKRRTDPQLYRSRPKAFLGLAGFETRPRRIKPQFGPDRMEPVSSKVPQRIASISTKSSKQKSSTPNSVCKKVPESGARERKSRSRYRKSGHELMPHAQAFPLPDRPGGNSAAP